MKAHIYWILGMSLALIAPAQAEERSPFFGSEATEAFQVVIEEPPALLQAEAALVVPETTCELQDCPSEAKLANGSAEFVAP